MLLSRTTIQCHTLQDNLNKIRSLGWQILQHHPYSPDLEHTDFHLFRSLENFRSCRTFRNEEAVNSFSKFFGKNTDFFGHVIEKFPPHLSTVFHNEGDVNFHK